MPRAADTVTGAQRMRTHLLDDVPLEGREALDVEAGRLTDWLDGVRVGTVYPSPAMRAAGHGSHRPGHRSGRGH